MNTVIIFSSSLAATTFGFAQGELIALYLVVQVTALARRLRARQADRHLGAEKSRLPLAAALVDRCPFRRSSSRASPISGRWPAPPGLGLGSVQAGTRAFFTQFIPEGKEAEYFGVYSLVGKSSAVIGPLVFGQVSAAFGSQRPAILSIAVFFVAGLALLGRVRGGGPNVGNSGVQEG